MSSLVFYAPPPKKKLFATADAAARETSQLLNYCVNLFNYRQQLFKYVFVCVCVCVCINTGHSQWYFFCGEREKIGQIYFLNYFDR